MTTDDLVMVGSYDYRVVALSILIAVLASYQALDLGERVTAARRATRLAWLIGGATVMGIGIWSMHYTGMLAFHLPVPILYHWPTTLVSLLTAMVASAVALFVVSRQHMGARRAWAASIFMGGAIVGLHYIGMASMRLPAMCHYALPLVMLSALFSVVFSLLALWLTFLLRDAAGGRRLRRVVSALLMGAAITAMHYTAMAAVSFTRSSEVPDLSHAVSISFLGTVGMSVVTVIVLWVAQLTALVDRLWEQRALLDELFEQAPQAVALMSADHRVVRVNREFTHVFGYTPQETLGRRLSELIVPDESRDEEQRDADLVAKGQRVEAEGVCQRKDGSRLHVAMVRVPVSLPGGQVAVYAIYRDITERQKVEEALRTYPRRLIEAQEAERQRIARELHDEIGQALTSVGLMLTLSQELPPDLAQARLVEAQALVRDLMGRVRNLALDLRPAMLDDLGLLPALLWLFERYTGQIGVQIDFTQFGLEGQRFGTEMETAAYRIVQEALTNVARHAGVRQVTVRAWAESDTLGVQIEDHGTGFDRPASQLSGYSSGLAGMHERTSILGGQLSIETALGAGTRVTAALPLRRQTEGSSHARDDSPRR